MCAQIASGEDPGQDEFKYLMSAICMKKRALKRRW